MNAARLMPPINPLYPESDGLPMAEGTEQFDWIVLVKENLECVFAQRDDVFVAGDLFWYPEEGKPGIRTAPDILIAFGRPKGPRRSYLQWEEDGIAPQVVWEILSPGNRRAELDNKFQLYEKYGVEEYYIYDPKTGEVFGWLRKTDRLEPIADMDGWISPLLNVRFAKEGDELKLYDPDGNPFQSFLDLIQQAEQAQQQAEQAQQQAEQAQQQAEQAQQQAKQARQQVEQAQRQVEEQAKLIQQLRAELQAKGAPPDA